MSLEARLSNRRNAFPDQPECPGSPITWGPGYWPISRNSSHGIGCLFYVLFVVHASSQVTDSSPRYSHTLVWWSIPIRLLSAEEVSLSVAVLTLHCLTAGVGQFARHGEASHALSEATMPCLIRRSDSSCYVRFPASTEFRSIQNCDHQVSRPAAPQNSQAASRSFDLLSDRGHRAETRTFQLRLLRSHSRSEPRGNATSRHDSPFGEIEGHPSPLPLIAPQCIVSGT